MSRHLSAPTAPWLGDVIPAAAASGGVRLQPSVGLQFPEARSVIVVVVDGLGWSLLEGHRGHVSTLRSFFSDTAVVSTCLPSTTAAALTSLTTGALPAQTQMMGYSVAREDAVMNLLHFAPSVTPEKWQPQPTYFEQLQGSALRPVVVSDPRFQASGLTRASMRGAHFIGAASLTDRFLLAHRAAAKEPSLVYVYWSEIDHAGHQHGVHSQEWLANLEEFDRELGAFLRFVPKDTTVVLTADHGMVDVEERIDIAQTPALSEGVRLLAGEGRAVHVHAEPGEGAAVRARWRDYLGDHSVVLGPDDYPRVFGVGPGNALVGDAVAFQGGRRVIVDSRHQSAGMIGQKGVHGSFTDAEMFVPVMVLA